MSNLIPVSKSFSEVLYLLLVSTFGVCYSVRYLPEFLRGLGLSFHKAVHFLIRHNTEKRREWIHTKLPALYADLVKNGWRIFFQDEVGFQTEGTLASTWGEKGEKIERTTGDTGGSI